MSEAQLIRGTRQPSCVATTNSDTEERDQIIREHILYIWYRMRAQCTYLPLSINTVARHVVHPK